MSADTQGLLEQVHENLRSMPMPKGVRLASEDELTPEELQQFGLDKPAFRTEVRFWLVTDTLYGSRLVRLLRVGMVAGWASATPSDYLRRVEQYLRRVEQKVLDAAAVLSERVAVRDERLRSQRRLDAAVLGD